jgi:biofilm PGA synthesis N-glycosyltransferase PgaC
MHESTAVVARAEAPRTADLSPELEGPIERPTQRFYVSVATKFVISAVFACAWVGFAVWLSRPWLGDLSHIVGPFGAVLVVALLAYVPGLVMSFMTMSLILDRQPPLRVRNPTTGVTILIAARNEENGIADTIRYAARSDYAGPVTIVLADNGSTDDTCAVAQRTADELGIDLVISHESTPGKAHALNTALGVTLTPYVVTVDADTLLHPQALRRLVSRLESAPSDTVAVAGSVMVRNSRSNLLTKMQEWDYYLGIASVKRMQGLYQSTLVAQGAFSIYRTEELRNIGGWPDAIGEDIVVTWRLMQDGARVYSEPTAVAFTDAPTNLRHFVRQRARWARGMLEGLAAVPPWRQRRLLSRFVAGIDLLIPLLDIGYALIWLPGVALFLLGYPLIVSLWTVLVFPITALVYGGLRRYQRHNVFDPLDLRVRRNRAGYVAFLLLYQVVCSVASIVGYTQQLANTTRRWK